MPAFYPLLVRVRHPKPYSRQTLRRFAIPAIAVLAVVFLDGCYYMQAIKGHADLMGRRQPIGDILADDNTPKLLAARLKVVEEARLFAASDLLLPDNGSYQSYADLERDYVVWNVFAAPEFSLEPKTWCFPVAGCVAYRGYFDEQDASKFAGRLEEDGFDVVVSGVAAYSTLGRFDDPVLNTMLRWSDLDLVSTIFHELAHQKLYVKGDSGFNESYASAVAEIGIDRWLAARGVAGHVRQIQENQDVRVEVFALVSQTRDALKTLYERDMPAADMRVEKRRLLDELSARAEAVTSRAGVRNWLAAPLNNARLVSSNLYSGQVDQFRAIYESCDNDIECFHGRTAEIAELSAEARKRRLQEALD